MVLAEAMGSGEFCRRVKLYATDVDTDALDKARSATYSATEVEMISPVLRKAYFDQEGSRFSVRKDIRRSVVFGRHDLVRDAPISRLDICTRRNVLMYLDTETQAGVLDRLHSALLPGGLLLLGKAETPLSLPDRFRPVELKLRIFEPLHREPGTPLVLLPPADRAAPSPAPDTLRAGAFRSGPHAGLTVDLGGALQAFNERARDLLGLHDADGGQPLGDLDISCRLVDVAASIDLAASVDRAHTLRAPLLVQATDRALAMGETCNLDIETSPLYDALGAPIGAAIALTDVTTLVRGQAELDHQTGELGSAYEALQGTNEELETINEELQSTNEEVHASNDELCSRSVELQRVNVYLEAILTGMHDGVVVLDAALMVQLWNDRSADLRGLGAEEVHNTPFFALDIGLSVEALRPLVDDALVGKADVSQLTLVARNRRGRSFSCRVTCTALRPSSGPIIGVTLLMEAIDLPLIDPRTPDPRTPDPGTPDPGTPDPAPPDPSVMDQPTTGGVSRHGSPRGGQSLVERSTGGGRDW